MQREPINSSNLHSTGHDETGMEVQFHKKGCAASRVLSPGPCDCGGGAGVRVVTDAAAHEPIAGIVFFARDRKGKKPEPRKEVSRKEIMSSTGESREPRRQAAGNPGEGTLLSQETILAPRAEAASVRPPRRLLLVEKGNAT